MAAIINGEGLPLEFFNAELERYKKARLAFGDPVTDEQAAASIVLDDQIAQILLAQGAMQNGFAVTDELLNQRQQALVSQLGSEEALNQWLAENNYTADTFRIALKQAIAAAWMRDQIIATIPQTAQQVHVRQILLYNQEAAEVALARLNAGEDFTELAAFYDPLTRGDIGWFPRGYLPFKNIEDAAFSLTPGVNSEIIESEVGFHILSVIAVEPDRPLSPDALITLQEKAVRDWVAQRRQESEIILAP